MNKKGKCVCLLLGLLFVAFLMQFCVEQSASALPIFNVRPKTFYESVGISCSMPGSTSFGTIGDSCVGNNGVSGLRWYKWDRTALTADPGDYVQLVFSINTTNVTTGGANYLNYIGQTLDLSGIYLNVIDITMSQTTTTGNMSTVNVSIWAQAQWLNGVNTYLQLSNGSDSLFASAGPTQVFAGSFSVFSRDTDLQSIVNAINSSRGDMNTGFTNLNNNINFTNSQLQDVKTRLEQLNSSQTTINNSVNNQTNQQQQTHDNDKQELNNAGQTQQNQVNNSASGNTVDSSSTDNAGNIITGITTTFNSPNASACNLNLGKIGMPGVSGEIDFSSIDLCSGPALPSQIQLIATGALTIMLLILIYRMSSMIYLAYAVATGNGDANDLLSSVMANQDAVIHVKAGK